MPELLRFPKISLSIRLLGVLVIALFCGQWIPTSMKSFLYASSLSLKEFLLFVLPAIIFTCLFSCLLSFQGSKALKFVLSLFAIVCISNFISVFIAYGIGSLQLIDLNLLQEAHSNALELQPLWEITFPKWLSNTQALALGFIGGTFFSFYPQAWACRFSEAAKQMVTVFLEKAFIPVLPLFVLGFVLKMQHDGILAQMIESYLQLLLLITCTYILYLGLLFFGAAKCNPSRFKYYLKNILPVALMGFSTMSSLATMPVTLKAAQKNTNDLQIPQAVIPATVNVHLIGVSIAIPMMALCILSTFGYALPSFGLYCKFALYFVLAKFAVAAVPGGGILVMLPLLESHLGFSAEMCGLITALYILFDPVVTLTNVLGNSALVIFCSRLFRSFNQKPDPEIENDLTQNALLEPEG